MTAASGAPRPSLSPGARSALTLTVLVLLVVVGALWGWKALTAPLPGALPACVDKKISVGDEVFRDQVVVSVYNGSARSGLAGLTQEKLVERGFGKGNIGNAERTKVTIVQSPVKNDPAARLVGKQFGKVKYVVADSLGEGVTVIIGERFKSLRPKAPESVTSTIDTTLCVVPGTE